MIPNTPQSLPSDNVGDLPSAEHEAVGAAATEHNGNGFSAQALLAGRPWVSIEHNGQHYRLQTTRAGKLILTK